MLFLFVLTPVYSAETEDQEIEVLIQEHSENYYKTHEKRLAKEDERIWNKRYADLVLDLPKLEVEEPKKPAPKPKPILVEAELAQPVMPNSVDFTSYIMVYLLASLMCISAIMLIILQGLFKRKYKKYRFRPHMGE